ncbi:MAG: histidine phosphatase family protein, partial [Candidatus Krumholzibacteria bacterium]|nr:histidine phosphatase family protein [Candidatus Krumholzibacteria bacterium]
MSLHMRKIYLIRHAESVWNSERRVQGTCLDVPLSPTGRLQARMLGERLKCLPFQAVYCSDAERAVKTVRIALGGDAPVTLSSGLRELCLGDWEGRLISEVREDFPEEIELWYRKPATVKINGAEDISSFR